MIRMAAAPFVMTAILTLAACASSAAKQQAPKEQSGNQSAKIDSPDDNVETEKNQSPTESTAKATCLTAASADNVRNLSIAQQGRKTSLCQSLLQESDSTTAMILYVTSPTCVSCKQTLKELNTHLAGRSNVKFVVAVPTTLDEYLETYSEAEISKFVRELAPLAQPATDPSGDIWLKLSKNPKTPVFPLAIAFNRQGKGYVLNADEIDSVALIRSNLFPKIDSLSR